MTPETMIRLHTQGHMFRAHCIAVGDRYRDPGLWRIFGYVGEYTDQKHPGRTLANPLIGPWRPTFNSALTAVAKRAITLGWLDEGFDE